MGQLDELLMHRNLVNYNIQKGFNSGFDLNEELEKARHGVYADNAQNRRLNRVGKEYGSKKQEEQPSGKQSSKEEQGSYQKMATEASDNALKRAAADPKASPEVKAAAKAEMKKRGSGNESNKSSYQNLSEKLLSGKIDDEYIRTMDTEITDNDPKIGEFMVKRALETFNNHKNSGEKILKEKENFAKKELKNCLMRIRFKLSLQVNSIRMMLWVKKCSTNY